MRRRMQTLKQSRRISSSIKLELKDRGEMLMSNFATTVSALTAKSGRVQDDMSRCARNFAALQSAIDATESTVSSMHKNSVDVATHASTLSERILRVDALCQLVAHSANKLDEQRATWPIDELHATSNRSGHKERDAFALDD
jgi:hypothetical protein